MEGYVVFMVGTIEDGIRGVQNVVGVLIKDRGWEGGRGRGEGGGGGGKGEGEEAERRRGARKKNGISNFIFSPPLFISLRRR